MKACSFVIRIVYVTISLKENQILFYLYVHNGEIKY